MCNAGLCLMQVISTRETGQVPFVFVENGGICWLPPPQTIVPIFTEFFNNQAQLQLKGVHLVQHARGRPVPVGSLASHLNPTLPFTANPHSHLGYPATACLRKRAACLGALAQLPVSIVSMHGDSSLVVTLVDRLTTRVSCLSVWCGGVCSKLTVRVNSYHTELDRPYTTSIETR